jgi:uncharacterized protein (DUF433 family)
VLEYGVMNYMAHIVRDPKICGGEPVIRGTRVPLRTVLASLAEGATSEEIIADFPTLSPEDVRAVIAFAAESARDDLPSPPIPTLRPA